MPVFNAEDYIEETISSILEQTFQDFILIIINDGSTDKTIDIVTKYNNSKIQIFNKKHSGIIDSFNYALEFINTEYTARIDSDDVYHPAKFENQIKFLDDNLNIAIVGTQANYLSQSGIISKLNINVPVEHKDILRNLFTFKRAIIQSTIVIRTKVLLELKGYLPDIYPEDFDLFFRLSQKYEMANLDKSLANIRIHNSYSHNNLYQLLAGYNSLIEKYSTNKNKSKLKIISKKQLLTIYLNRKSLNQFLNNNKTIAFIYLFFSGLIAPIDFFNMFLKKIKNGQFF